MRPTAAIKAGLIARAPAILQRAAPAVPAKLSKMREERNVELCEGMIDVAAALFNVSSKEMRQASRAGAAVTRVRQIAMYVAHVMLGMSMYEVARGFGRERTTVRHACHLIEDMRDDEDFDQIVAMTERVAAATLRQRSGA